MFFALLLVLGRFSLPSSNPSLECRTASCLSLIVFLEHLTEENRIDGSVQFSGENKPKSVKGPDVLEGDETRQSGDGLDSLPPSQSEVGKGPQKKVKRRDQRASDSLDSQTKPRSTTSLQRKSSTTQAPGDKESRASTQLRRNVSSAGRLQGLGSNVPGKRESKKAEVYSPSGRKRPKSLEIATYSREGEPPNSEALLTQEETSNRGPHSAVIPTSTAILNGRPAGALEKGTGNPEHSAVPDEETFRNMPFKISVIGEEQCAACWKEDGTGSPQTVGEMAGRTPHDSCDPEVCLSHREKPAQIPEGPAPLGPTACRGTLPSALQNSLLF